MAARFTPIGAVRVTMLRADFAVALLASFLEEAFIQALAPAIKNLLKAGAA